MEIHNKFRGKFFRRRYYVVAAVICLLVLTSLIFIAAHYYHAPVKQISETLPAPKAITPPTAIDPNFLTQVNDCFIPTAAVYKYILRVTSGFRTTDEQDQIYQQGRTTEGHIVTWAPVGKSLHNYGFAVDVVDRWRGYAINWIKLGKIGAYCGLEQVDDTHFEHRAGLTTAQFADGIKPPPLTLPCAIMAERANADQPLTLKDLQNCGAPKF